MFIGQSQRRRELLDLAHCVYTELEIKQTELVIQTLRIFLCTFTKCPSVPVEPLQREKVSGHVEIQIYCSYTNIIHSLTHTLKSS